MSEANNTAGAAKKTKPQSAKEQDSPWKTVVGKLFELFLAFYFPLLYRTIDWKRGYEQLDTELARIKRNSATGKRVVDKLIKVFLLNGQEQWILVHVEIQSYRDITFPLRMFTYNYLLRHRFKKPIESLAILTDSNGQFRPTHYHEQLTVTETNFKFGMVKLLDYRTRLTELEQETNPFALVTLAHLKAMELKGQAKEQARLEWKVQLVELLDARNLPSEMAGYIFDFIDWIVVLPDEKELDFQERITKGRVLMPYVNNLERNIERRITGRILAEGLEQGRQEGTLEVVLRLLNKRFGPLELELAQQTSALDIVGLNELSDNLLDFTSKADLTNWLLAHRPQAAATEPQQ